MNGRDLKAEIARSGVTSYRVAAECNINPVRLSRLLNEHDPLSDRDRERIARAIQRLASPAPLGAA